MNSRSNLAYTSRSEAVSYPVKTPYAPSPNVRIKVSKKKQQAAQKRANVLSLVKIMAVMCLAFLVLYRGLMITDKSSAVEQKQSELEAIVTSNEKLQFDIDRSLDLKKIESIARDQLGMRRAEKYQTVYLDLAQADYVEKVATNEFSPFGRVADFFSSIMAYLD